MKSGGDVRMYIGDFKYREKEDVQTMIQILEKELFRNKNSGQYDSRPS
jgi:hypothetical protein